MSLILPWWWRLALVGAIVAASMAFGAIQMHRHDQARYDALAQRFEEFKAGVKGLGEAAAKRAAAQAQADQKAKEKTDAEAKRLHADNARLAGELRDERARSRYVPAAPAGASRPDLACFDRAELESAIQRLDDRVSQLVEEGGAAVADLDAAKHWAQRP